MFSFTGNGRIVFQWQVPESHLSVSLFVISSFPSVTLSSKELPIAEVSSLLPWSWHFEVISSYSRHSICDGCKSPIENDVPESTLTTLSVTAGVQELGWGCLSLTLTTGGRCLWCVSASSSFIIYKLKKSSYIRWSIRQICLINSLQMKGMF